MTNRIDDLVNSFMLRKFRESRTSLRDPAPQEILDHLKDCPDTHLVHPKAVDDGYGFGPMTDPYDFVQFEATAECPHGNSAHYEFREDGTFDGVVRGLERHALELEHKAFRESLKPAIEEALVALQDNPRQSFLLLNGINYPSGSGEKRAEAGSVVTDLPVKDIPWLLEHGQIKGLCTGDQFDQMDPDACSCPWCRYAALTEGDRDWLLAHGWDPPAPATPHPHESKDRRSIWIR
jgi:hypothetical protein